MDLEKIIKFHRKKAGLSRKELAELAGIGKTVIYDIEHGKKTIRFNIVNSILEALNIKIIFDSPFMEKIRENEKS
jgi:transcriptional regulator with XRE-family HTH domain